MWLQITCRNVGRDHMGSVPIAHKLNNSLGNCQGIWILWSVRLFVFLSSVFLRVYHPSYDAALSISHRIVSHGNPVSHQDTSALEIFPVSTEMLMAVDVSQNVLSWGTPPCHQSSGVTEDNGRLGGLGQLMSFILLSPWLCWDCKHTCSLLLLSEAKH